MPRCHVTSPPICRDVASRRRHAAMSRHAADTPRCCITPPRHRVVPPIHRNVVSHLPVMPRRPRAIGCPRYSAICHSAIGDLLQFNSLDGRRSATLINQFISVSGRHAELSVFQPDPLSHHPRSYFFLHSYFHYLVMVTDRLHVYKFDWRDLEALQHVYQTRDESSPSPLISPLVH
jgi:hypothetical protein